MLPARDPEEVPWHPAVGQEDAKLQHTWRYPGQPAVIEVGQGIAEEAPLHLVPLRVVPVQDRQRLRTSRHVLEAVGHEPGDGDVVSGLEVNRFTS